MRETLGIPHRRVQKLIRFDRDEVMAWAKRWVQDAQDQGIDVKADPSGHNRSLLHALASLPA
jgi:hypothetical protein